MSKAKPNQASLFDWADESPETTAAAKAQSTTDEETVTQAADRVNDLFHQAAAPTTMSALGENEISPDNDSLGSLRPTLVRASAGSGKTYQLTARLMRILLQGAPPETVLATTFTRKAAGEILTRLLETLAAAADPEQPDALNALREQVDLEKLDAKTCLSLLNRLMRNIHRLRISTLDSLFSQIARSFPFELDLPPAWRLTDEIEEVWMLQRAIDQMVDDLDHSETTTLLSMLGKGEVRRSITRELADVVQLTYSIGRGADLSVWKKVVAPKLPAANKITAVASQFLAAEAKQKTIKQQLEKMGDLLQCQDFVSLVESGTLMTNIARARRTGDPVKYGRAKFPAGLEDAFEVVYQIGRCETLRLLAAQNEATGQILQAYSDQIEAVKQSARAIGFSDVTARLAKHFEQFDPQVLAARMDGSIDHLLLDEFQDTSAIQWQVIRPLVIACTSASKTSPKPKIDGEIQEVPKSFFCVGDTKQAIYGWRGGVAEIFDAVTDEIDDIDEVPLNKSYRSSPVIMEAVNAVFSRIHRHPIATLSDPSDRSDKSVYQAEAIRGFAENFPAHQTNRSLPGHARLMTCRKPESDENPKTVCFEAAARLALEIHAAAPDKTIGILTRKNQAVGELILALENLGLEASQEGGNPLTDSAAVEVVLSALMMAEHPGDGRWAFHVSSTPLAKIPDFNADLIRTKTEEIGIAETVFWLADHLAPSCGQRDTVRLKQLTRLALQYASNPQPRLRDFVTMVRQKRIERPQQTLIRVMTVHQSKGLEFDTVILPQLDEELVGRQTKPVAMRQSPGQPATGLSRYLGSKHWHYFTAAWQQAFGKVAAAQMTESLCLMYVAMTRARQSLQMIITPTTKPEFESKTMASLIFHAVAREANPTEAESVLWELGDSGWMNR